MYVFLFDAKLLDATKFAVMMSAMHILRGKRKKKYFPMLSSVTNSQIMISSVTNDKLKMALFILIALMMKNCFICVTGLQSMRIDVGNTLKIIPSTLTAGQYVGLYKAGDNLNLSCIFSNEFHMSNVVLDWNLPKRSFNRSKSVVTQISSNLVNIMVENLTESDSGEYKCIAYVNSLWKSEKSINMDQSMESMEKSIWINVKTRKGGCSDTMFQCPFDICIPKRFTCDGYKDCRYGEDELWDYCGSRNPCDNKLRCPDLRCIPYAWCCDPERDRNCTIKVKHSCCIHMEKQTRDIDSDLGYPYEQHMFNDRQVTSKFTSKFNDLGFFANFLHRLDANSTTIYTVIGCALSFMFIVTVIILIKSCRTQTRRSVVSRCPAANRNLSILRSSNLHSNNLPFYDFNRIGCNTNDLMSVNPLVVTYINNGVQFVGRPIDPPPYCEILTSPPREGPPPPYASQESLYPKRDLDAGVETGDNESDSLLTSQNRISVISCNAMDNCEESTDVVLHPTEE